MKKIIVFLFCACIYHSAQSQWILGVHAGYSNSFILTNISNQTYSTLKNGHGFGVSAMVKYSFNNWIGVETGLTFIQKNYSIDRTGEYSGIYEERINSYFQVPVIMQIKLFGYKNFRMFADAGLYAGFWTFGQLKGVIPNIINFIYVRQPDGNYALDFGKDSYNQTYNFNSIKDNRFEAGWVGGLTATYAISHHWAIALSGRYYGSFTDQQKQYMTNQIPRYNQSIFVSAGILFYLGE